MADNVIEVEFGKKPMEPLEAMLQAGEKFGWLLDEIRSIREQVAREKAWHKEQHDFERGRIRGLEASLRAERAARFDVSDESVLDTLVKLYAGEPVAAGQVAGRLFREPTHSTKVRVGLALGRLEAKGCVARLRHAEPGLPSRWTPLAR